MFDSVLLGRCDLQTVCPALTKRNCERSSCVPGVEFLKKMGDPPTILRDAKALTAPRLLTACVAGTT